MIKCAICQKVTKANERTYEFIISKREKIYHNVILRGREIGRRQIRTLKLNNEKLVNYYVKNGLKIVK